MFFKKLKFYLNIIITVITHPIETFRLYKNIKNSTEVIKSIIEEVTKYSKSPNITRDDIISYSVNLIHSRGLTQQVIQSISSIESLLLQAIKSPEVIKDILLKYISEEDTNKVLSKLVNIKESDISYYKQLILDHLK